MVTNCRNCAGRLVFDPSSQKLVCESCGSMFKPEEFDISEKEELLDQKAVSMNQIQGTDDKDFMDCYVYTCASCGGEIIINGTEASTACIYCGNPAVVFSRIARHKRPQYVIPFKITKEEAVKIVRERFWQGRFIPKEIKNFKADNVRGIYIPYWIIDCDHKAAVVVKGQVSSGKSSRTEYFGRAGRLKLRDFPLDASKMLSDASSQRLEPFNLRVMKPFDEDYLLGFYSNISDITYGHLRNAASIRCEAYFNEAALKDVSGASRKSIYTSKSQTSIDYNNVRYAMLPAWFVTYEFKGKHNTILVNGQTGKIVCGVPWNKVKFFALLILTGIALTVVSYFILNPILNALFASSSGRSSSNSNGKLVAAVVMGAISLFTIGIRKIVKVIKSIELTQAYSIFNFVKKRQE
ncbi:MAG: TFIIB-type zinc ribbon-containing protein [Clostridiales bacterium]|nr:TFIIB-type zinc ribbon-containing protein [Clostridiales bacterium]